MPDTTLNLKGLPESARDPVQELTETLQRLAGDNLRGLTVFGDVTTADFVPNATLIRSVALLGGMDLALLDQLRRAGLRLGRRHLQAPLMMTPAYIKDSCDTFPLEFLEIQQTHTAILGPDTFGELEFEREHIRLQAERELKRELINLRQGLLASAGKDKLLGQLCRDALAQTVRVLRGILWLRQVRCPNSRRGILEEAQRQTSINMAGLLDVVEGSARSDFISLQRFYRDVERLSDYVNRL